MASKSLADIIAAVRYRGDYRDTIRHPDSSLTVEVQAAFAEFYELVASTHEGYWDTDATVSAVANQGYVALPASTWQVRGIDYWDGSNWRELAQIGISERNRYSSTSDEPRAYRLTARGADLFPTPNAIYTLRVTYTPSAPTLSAARDFFNGWEEYVLYGALVRLALNEERAAGEWQAQLERQAARITGGASGRRAQEPEYIPLRTGHDVSDLEFDGRRSY
jgi:hypothetical protein